LAKRLQKKKQIDNMELLKKFHLQRETFRCSLVQVLIEETEKIGVMKMISEALDNQKK
jgi:hypothetical protein